MDSFGGKLLFVCIETKLYAGLRDNNSFFMVVSSEISGNVFQSFRKFLESC